MITVKELLCNQSTFESLSEEQKANITELHEKINKVRAAYGKPMTVTSGFRSMEKHLAIYQRKGIKRVPMKSNHLTGSAVDISDIRRDLQKWCLANEKKLAEIGLWMEDFRYTSSWIHFQIKPPQSQKRFFIP